jgi:hypothetical protein
MPADFPESGGTERGLMGRHVEIVVLYLKRTVFQEKSPGQRHALADFSRHSGVQAVAAAGGKRRKVHGRIRTDRHEAPPRPEAGRYAGAHGFQLVLVRRVVQEVSRHRQIEFGRQGQVLAASHAVVDAQRLLRLLLTGEFDHALRQVEAQHSSCALGPQPPGVESLPAGDVHDRLAGKVSDQVQQREGFDAIPPRLQLGPLVSFGDGIVVGTHDGVFSMPIVLVRENQNSVAVIHACRDFRTGGPYPPLPGLCVRAVRTLGGQLVVVDPPTSVHEYHASVGLPADIVLIWSTPFADGLVAEEDRPVTRLVSGLECCARNL